MKRSAFGCLLFVLLLAGCAPQDSSSSAGGSAGTGTMAGKVFDGSGNALSGVSVVTSPVTSTQTTGADGAFTFSGIGAASYTVTAQRVGFVKSSVSATVSQSTTTTVNLSVTAGPSYASAVQPIFNANCTSAGCHSASGSAGNYNLTTYAGATAKNVAAFDADGSTLFKRVSGTSAGAQMPQGGSPLSGSDQQTIKNWINAGLPNN